MQGDRLKLDIYSCAKKPNRLTLLKNITPEILKADKGGKPEGKLNRIHGKKRVVQEGGGGVSGTVHKRKK